MTPAAHTTTTGARERLLAAALRRFAEDGAVGVNLDDVRREAGVSVGALYHHFEDKRALVDALFLELTGRYQAGFLDTLRDHTAAEPGVRAAVRYHLRWVSDHRAEARVLLEEPPTTDDLRARNRAFLGEVRAWYQPHVHYGALRDLPLIVVYALWLGPAQEYSRLWLGGRAKRMPTQIAATLAGAAWNALKEQP